MQPSPRLDGAALRTTRLAENLTQRQLAARAGVSVATVQRLERPTTDDCKAPTLVRLCRALDVRIEQLLHA